VLVARVRARCIERQNRQHGGRLGQHRDKLRKTKAYLIKLPCQKLPADQPRNLKAVADRQIACFGKACGQNFSLTALKMLDRFFAYGQHTVVAALCIGLDSLQDIGVITARQTAVTRDDDIQAAVCRPLGEVGAVKV